MNGAYSSTTPTSQNVNSGISCDVGNCVFNTQNLCTAKIIKVGPQYAASSADTVCATFKPRR